MHFRTMSLRGSIVCARRTRDDRTRENGWFVYDGQLEHELEHPAAEPHHSAAADERDQELMEAMVLCPPKSL